MPACRDVRVRLEMPTEDGGPGGAGTAVLRLDRLVYSDAGSGDEAAQPAAADTPLQHGETAKRVEVEGLLLELLPEDVNAELAPEAEGLEPRAGSGEAASEEGDGWEGEELEVPAGCAPLLACPAGGGVSGTALLRTGADGSLQASLEVGAAEVQVKPAQVC